MLSVTLFVLHGFAFTIYALLLHMYLKLRIWLHSGQILVYGGLKLSHLFIFFILSVWLKKNILNWYLCTFS